MSAKSDNDQDHFSGIEPGTCPATHVTALREAAGAAYVHGPERMPVYVRIGTKYLPVVAAGHERIPLEGCPGAMGMTFVIDVKETP